MDPNGPVAQRFPLVPRIRPTCLPLVPRVDKLIELAKAAQAAANHGTASSVFNQAALLASDLGMPDLARQWCHRHAACYLTAADRSGMDAIRGLEPVVNMARLHIRAGNGIQGHRILLDLYQAVSDGGTTTVDGITIPLDLTSTDSDRQKVRQWLWRVIIADGTRALTTAGRWQDALDHLQQHHGVGTRMLDGRQVAILARATTADYIRAQQLIADTTPGEPEEDAVTACLAILCRPVGRRTTEREIETLLVHCRRLEIHEGLSVFHTRLRLAIVDATDQRDHPDIRSDVSALVARIQATGDGYSARDIRTHDGCSRILTARQLIGLDQTTDACALGRGFLPPTLSARVEAALDTSERVIMQALAPHPMA